MPIGAFIIRHMRAETFIRAGLEFKMDVVKRAEDAVPAFEYRIKISREKITGEPLLGRL